MKNKPLLNDDEFLLSQHRPNDKWGCLCPDCKEWRRLERKRQSILDKERKQYDNENLL